MIFHCTGGATTKMCDVSMDRVVKKLNAGVFDKGAELCTKGAECS